MHNKYILYIDDDPGQLELVQMLLERTLSGVIVEVCCGSRDAEAFLNSRCYELVICDVALPGELGTTIAKKILERDLKQPIYLMSEYTGAEIRKEAESLGLTLKRKLSQKDPAEFLQQVKQLLERRSCPEPGRLGEAADTRGTTAEPPAAADRGEEAPPKPIRLTSPHVQAARAAIGRGA